MRILVITNYYGTHSSGGEELSCRQVIDGLNQRGHTTLVLTSRPSGQAAPEDTPGVRCSLFLEMDTVPWRHSLTFFTHRKVREKLNLQTLQRAFNEFKPDIVYIWGMWNLHWSLAGLAETRYPDRVIYRFATYWPTLPSQHVHYWRTRGRTWFSRLPKLVLAPIALALLAREPQRQHLKFRHAMCVSAATRAALVEAGVPVSMARIIHTGLPIERYQERSAPTSQTPQTYLELLYAGRLAPDKGLSTAIEALASLVNRQDQRHIRLTIVGAGSPDYERHLRQLVDQQGLAAHVVFQGWKPPGEIPALLRNYDVLLLPSIWPEPFSRAVLEGMASGLVVVATRIGGTPEVIVDGENGLLFAPGDSADLAAKLSQLAEDLGYRQRLARAGRKTVLARFTHTAMMDAIEAFLQEVAESAHGDGHIADSPIQFEGSERSSAAAAI